MTEYLIVSGRRTGMTDLKKRLAEMAKKAETKRVSFHWESNGSISHDIYLSNEKGERVFEETIISGNTEISKKIHAFLDIFETELAKIP